MVPASCKIDKDLNQTTDSQELTLAGQWTTRQYPASLLLQGPGRIKITLVYRAPSFSPVCFTKCSSINFTMQIFTESHRPVPVTTNMQWMVRKKGQLRGGKTGKVQSKFSENGLWHRRPDLRRTRKKSGEKGGLSKMVKTLRRTQKAGGAPNTTGQKHSLICILILFWSGRSQDF